MCDNGGHTNIRTASHGVLNLFKIDSNPVDLDSQVLSSNDPQVALVIEEANVSSSVKPLGTFLIICLQDEAFIC